MRASGTGARGWIRSVGLSAALGLAVVGAGWWGTGTARGGTAEPERVRLARPPFRYWQRPPARGKRTPVTRLRLVKVSERPNGITDVDAWFQRNGLARPEMRSLLREGDRGEIPEAVPMEWEGGRLVRAIRDTRHLLLLYGPDFSGGEHVVLFDPGRAAPRLALDFREYVSPPRSSAAEREFVQETVQWADEAGETLYVSNFHNTYAKSSWGLNGYLTAIDLRSRKPVWRSRPLVCNTRNFLVEGDALLTGYGFTAEADFLYVLDRNTGAVAQTVKLQSGPEYLVRKGNRLFVRTYNRDYVFRLAR
jgi:hypothetical protein